VCCAGKCLRIAMSLNGHDNGHDFFSTRCLSTSVAMSSSFLCALDVLPACMNADVLAFICSRRGATHTVKVFTDHVTLQYFHQQRKLSGRQQRWADIFMDFDLDIVYKRGADTLLTMLLPMHSLVTPI
jgi:RNase H-like domain found in reverse transcriptase